MIVTLDPRQHTVSQDLDFVGIGLHSGRPAAVRLIPAPPGHGVRFTRHAGAPGNALLASWRNVVATELCTTLGDPSGARFATVEHLLAALHGCGVDNALVEVRGGELPILDGSAGPFVERLHSVPLAPQDAPRTVLVVERPIGVARDASIALIAPAPARRITAEIEFPQPTIGRQRRRVCLDEGAFAREVASARTFGFSEHLADLHRAGLARGGSRHNAVVLDRGRVLNPEGLRFPDEFVRHKLLDMVGDLALAGLPIIGHVFGYRPGHALNTALVRALLTNPDAVSVRRADELPATSALDPLGALLAQPDLSPQGIWWRLLGDGRGQPERAMAARDDSR